MNKFLLILAKLVAGGTAGYVLSHHLSHPSGHARKHVPIARVGRVQLTPNLLIATRNKSWHIHHWAYLPTLYLPLIAVVRPFLKRSWMHGLVLGAILHGLTFRDRFRFIK